MESNWYDDIEIDDLIQLPAAEVDLLLKEFTQTDYPLNAETFSAFPTLMADPGVSEVSNEVNHLLSTNESTDASSENDLNNFNLSEADIDWLFDEIKDPKYGLSEQTFDSSFLLPLTLNPIHKKTIESTEYVFQFEKCRPKAGTSNTLSSVEYTQRSKKSKFETVRRQCSKLGCPVLCKSRSSLTAHLLRRHGVKQFCCRVRGCTASFTKQRQFIGHRTSAHGKLRHWPCAKCDKSFPSYRHLSVHFYYSHTQGRFRCSIDGCTTLTTNYKAIQLHLRHHSIGCPKVFPQCSKSTLVRHENIHGNVKFCCTWPTCQFSTIYCSNLSRHIRRAHFGQKETMTDQ